MTVPYLKYIIARSHRNRPLCQHIRRRHDSTLTLCGNRMTGWRIDYMRNSIPLLLCQRCKRAAERGES